MSAHDDEDLWEVDCAELHDHGPHRWQSHRFGAVRCPGRPPFPDVEVAPDGAQKRREQT